MGDERHEISVIGELTGTGFKAGVKSRWASAVDRLWGSKVDNKTIPIEAENAEAVALSSGRVKMIEAMGDLAVERLKSDPEFAARALENFLPAVLRKQENKDAVVEMALDDLRSHPSSVAEEVTGPHTLGEDFLNKFDRYAEDASSDVVREKWGKVLAAEVRQPNTFSSKVLRVIDEMEAGTAQLFERVCKHHVAGVLLKPTLGELPYTDAVALSTAGLIVDPGLGQISKCVEVADSSDIKLWFWAFGSEAISLSKTHELPPSDDINLTNDDGLPAVPVYVLTDAGRAIATIVPDRASGVISELMKTLSGAAPQSEVRRYRRESSSSSWTMIEKIPAGGVTA